jgi:CheY-like chemotaxis protein
MTFRVSDSGIGIPVEKHASIFKPFIQADLDTTKKYGGTGLGLSICSAIVQMMGGTIAVMSDVGHGSTFSVTLTLPTVSGEAKKAPYEPIGLDAPLPSKTILVAEDNTTNQMLIQILLQKMGMKCLIANDGVEAVKMYQEHEVDMILMDGHMPNLDGVGATKAILELQAHSGLRKVPIVALTASAIKGDREYFLSMGMDDYLSKPITVEALEKVMRIYF